MKYRKCNKCGWVHFVISLAQAVFTQNPFKCWKCGNDHENFTATLHAPLGATLQPIFEPRTLSTSASATKEPEDDSDTLELALDVGAAILDIASAVSDSDSGSGSDSWGGGGGGFGGGGASSDF